MKKKNPIREKMISIKLSIEEAEMLEMMREDQDINISSYLRKCIRNKYDELYRDKK